MRVGYSLSQVFYTNLSTDLPFQVNLFDKKWLVFPIHEPGHYSVVIACNPKPLVAGAKAQFSRFVLLHLDSLPGMVWLRHAVMILLLVL